MKNLNTNPKLTLQKTTIIKFKNSTKNPNNRVTACPNRVTETMF